MTYENILPSFSEPLPFETMMARAQELHSLGEVAAAAMVYGLASAQAPNDSEFGRALRGQASGLHRQGGEYFGRAFELAESAVRIHSDLVDAVPASPEHRTMRIESARVAARMVLDKTVHRERSTQHIDEAAYLDVGRFLDMALDDLQYIPGDTQHAKNFYPLGAIALALMPRRQQEVYLDASTSARDLAWHARRTALSAERSNNPTSAGLGRAHQARAAGLATYRAGAASAVTSLATPKPSTRRRQAIRIAHLPLVL